MSNTVTSVKNRRTLLLPTSLAVLAAKSVTTLTRSGTTATATSTSHGYSVGDWVVISGADRPQYNGPFKLVTVADANTFTYTMESDPGATAGGTISSQKGQISTAWYDGTTAVEGVTSVGALATSMGDDVVVCRVTNGATGPGVAASASIYESATGGSGTWRLVAVLTTTTTAATATTLRKTIGPVKCVIVFFSGNTNQAVYVDATGNENTQATLT